MLPKTCFFYSNCILLKVIEIILSTLHKICFNNLIDFIICLTYIILKIGTTFNLYSCVFIYYCTLLFRNITLFQGSGVNLTRKIILIL